MKKTTACIGTIITALFLAISFGCGGNGEGEETGGTIGTGGTGTGGTTTVTGTDTSTSTSIGTGGQAGGTGGVGGMGTGGTTTVVVNPVPDWCKNLTTPLPTAIGNMNFLPTGLYDVSCNGVAWNVYVTSSNDGRFTISGYGFLTSELGSAPANSDVPSGTLYNGISATSCFNFAPVVTTYGAPKIVGNGAKITSDPNTYEFISVSIIDAQTDTGIPCTMTWVGGGFPHCIAPVGCN